MSIAEEAPWAEVGPGRGAGFPGAQGADLRKQGSVHSSGRGARAASSGDCPAQPLKRQRRDAVTRVWEWLDVTVSPGGGQGTPAAPAVAEEVVFLGNMHLSDGSAGTTAITAALDNAPCETVDPCVSSLPDDRSGAPKQAADASCVSSRLCTGRPPPAEGGTAVPAAECGGDPSPGDTTMRGPEDGAGSQFRTCSSGQELLATDEPAGVDRVRGASGRRTEAASRSASMGDAGSCHGMGPPQRGAAEGGGGAPALRKLPSRKRKLHDESGASATAAAAAGTERAAADAAPPVVEGQ